MFNTVQKHAVKEATVDTMIGLVINVPLNFILIWVALQQQWSALTTTITLTIAFSIFAIARKTFLRLHFQKRVRKVPVKQSHSSHNIGTATHIIDKSK